MPTNKPIVINPQAIILLKEKGKDITLTLDAKAELEKILYVKNLIEDVWEHVQNKLSEEFDKHGLKKVVAGDLVISRRLYGGRYQISGTPAPEFTKAVTYTKPDAEAIEQYIHKENKLPEGIGLKDRSEKVSIVKREEE